NPDGDSLGCEIGFAEWLISIGKEVRVFNHSHIPENYKFLDRESPIIEIFDAEKHAQTIAEADAFFLLDTNDPLRAKSLAPFISAHKNPVLIDHHLDPKDFAKERFIDTDATSTGEMIFNLIKASQKDLGGSISRKAAQALYVAIMTDTGSFRFPRTDSDIFRISADLIDLGADPVVAYNETYNSAKASRVLLIGKCLSSLKFFFDDRLATQAIMQKDLNEAGAVEEEVDGFVQFPLQVATVEFSIFILELREGWKVSFRSKGNKSAAEVSKLFGGNGHFHAAGARIFEKKSFEALHKEICDAVFKFL
ncbi:MAG: DHH family phosphoesterase, partial [Bacteroidota bacterium]|nr:DHH family phosphoesterase [Bacteroidota bacterium]